jgi:hypothetical protein
MDDSKRLENIWRGLLRVVEENYSAAFRHACKVQGDYQVKDLPSPDGGYALRQALRAENQARAKYMSVLKIYTHVAVHGELPKDTGANAVADSDGEAQVASCPIRDQLERRVYSAIQILAKYSSRLVEITGTGKPDEVIETTRHCGEQRLVIQELEKEISAHRAEHGC